MIHPSFWRPVALAVGVAIAAVLGIAWSAGGVIGGGFHGAAWAQEPESSPEGGAIHMAVMDPLCDKLACDCVQGYAQRKYETLAQYLAERLNRRVRVGWGESIQSAVESLDSRADIVIGKYSVVLHNGRTLGWTLRPVARLTGADGSTYQRGLIVVRATDPAQSLSDLSGYRIFFGPVECDEKYAAPIELLREHRVAIPDPPEFFGACSEAAAHLVALPDDARAAAVISSYAAPLLEGCGTVKKGDLRVLAESKPIPFVVVFVHEAVDEAIRSAITESLLDVAADPSVLSALETAEGFVSWDEDDQVAPRADATAKKN
jgi:ABC-type phosphate/phosphonate transport system substrate-binding protein